MTQSPKRKLFLSKDIENKLRNGISNDDFKSFSQLSRDLKWGKPSWSCTRLLLEILGFHTNRLRKWALKLAQSEDPMMRRYASSLLERLWSSKELDARAMLRQLADDEHWLVREEAHSTLGSLASAKFEEISPLLKLWTKEWSPNLKRAVAIAVRHVGNLKQSEMAETLIKLVEELLPERNLYVRKNLGPYVIGDGLLRCFPDITLSYLRKWAKREDEQTRWNVAMAFASYGGKRNWQAGMEILSDLATDERRYVWRAVASALRYLSKRHPEIRLTLREWLDDPKRRKVAAEVLSQSQNHNLKKDRSVSTKPS
jgi:hypothetical protein